MNGGPVTVFYLRGFLVKINIVLFSRSVLELLFYHDNIDCILFILSLIYSKVCGTEVTAFRVPVLSASFSVEVLERRRLGREALRFFANLRCACAANTQLSLACHGPLSTPISRKFFATRAAVVNAGVVTQVRSAFPFELSAK